MADIDRELEWIKRCQGGDREAFGLLVERYQRRVFSLVFHILRRRDAVEDVAQEVFIKAFVGIRGYDFRASFGTWVSQIAVNHCYDYLRRQKVSRVSYYSVLSEERQRELEARLESPEPGGLTAEQQTVVRDLVGKLLERAPADDRVVLTLKELEGLSVEEVADILKLNPSTVKVRLHRARKRMLNDLKRWRQEGR
jgi:RNA polymerase sigma-70 factor (ECF subfamily)